MSDSSQTKKPIFFVPEDDDDDDFDDDKPSVKPTSFIKIPTISEILAAEQLDKQLNPTEYLIPPEKQQKQEEKEKEKEKENNYSNNNNGISTTTTTTTNSNLNFSTLFKSSILQKRDESDINDNNKDRNETDKTTDTVANDEDNISTFSLKPKFSNTPSTTITATSNTTNTTTPNTNSTKPISNTTTTTTTTPANIPKPILKPIKLLPIKPVNRVVNNNNNNNNNTTAVTSTSTTTTTTTTTNNSSNSNNQIVVQKTTDYMNVYKSLTANESLRGNPIFRCFLASTKFDFSNTIKSDFVMSSASCCLYTSLKDYRLKPTNIAERAKNIPTWFELRVLVVVVNIDDCVALLEELSHVCIQINLVLFVAWSVPEAARYIEGFKILDTVSPDIIKTKQSSLDKTMIQDVLTTFKGINKTDANTLISSYGTVKKMFDGNKESFSLCPGFGEKKVNSLYNIIHQPFKATKKISKTMNSPPPTATNPKTSISSDNEHTEKWTNQDDFDNDFENENNPSEGTLLALPMPESEM